MYLEILTPAKSIFSGEVKLIRVPGSKGSFEILNNHAPIISTLDTGPVKIITPDDKIRLFSIESGVVQVMGNKIIVLAESLTETEQPS